MSENISGDPPSEEIPADDLDSLLDQMDPGFREDLKRVSEVQPESDIDQESSVELSEQEHADGEFETPRDLSRWSQFKVRLKSGLLFQFRRLKTELVSVGFKSFIFLKTQPLEFVKYIFVQLKVLSSAIGLLRYRFFVLPRAQKLTIFAMVILGAGAVMLTFKNLKGSWIPTLNPPLVVSLAQKADDTFVISDQPGEVFYRAFPRDPDIFLFKKFKVNLMPSEGYPNPMGAFEVVVQLDSKEAAVESQDRETELHDLVQREFETMIYPSLLTDLGKQQLKNQIKTALDSRLSQGWVEDVHFQTFILKP